MATGIRQRHGRGCKQQGRCKCPYEAFVYSKRDGKKIRKTFPTRAAAAAWRDDARGQVRRSELRAPAPTTVSDAAEAWLQGARSQTIRPRSGEPYKPSAVRAYETVWRLRLEPAFGRAKLSAISRNDVQDLVDELVAQGLNPSTVATTINLLRNIYRRALKRGEITVNPTSGVEMPTVRGGRVWEASPGDCTRLLAALPEPDRPIWATAMYAGLRVGELRALRIQDIDTATGVIHVCRGWDKKEGEIQTKSGKDRRVPITGILRDYLDQHLLSLKRTDGLVFGASGEVPFADTALQRRANSAWANAGLHRVTLHECRHAFASLMIAAGVNIKALQSYMGHSTIVTTMDRYGHLLPGSELEAAGLLDAYLQRADTQARVAALEA